MVVVVSVVMGREAGWGMKGWWWGREGRHTIWMLREDIFSVSFKNHTGKSSMSTAI